MASTKTSGTVEREEAIRELEGRRAVFVARNERNPNLWDDYIADCDLMLARLRAGLSLTRHQRGLPEAA